MFSVDVFPIDVFLLRCGSVCIYPHHASFFCFFLFWILRCFTVFYSYLKLIRYLMCCQICPPNQDSGDWLSLPKLRGTWKHWTSRHSYDLLGQWLNFKKKTFLGLHNLVRYFYFRVHWLSEMKQQAKTLPKRLIPKCSMSLVYSPTFTTQVKPFMWGFP